MAEETAQPAPGDDVASLLQATPPAGAEAGAEARLTTGFVTIAAEIEKLSGPSAEQPDWSVVADQSRTYLAERAKDVRVVAYLVVAWAAEGGLAGLVKGFELLTGLLDDQWEQLFPPVQKAQARAGALTWLSEQLRPHLLALLEEPGKQEAQALVDSFQRYQAAIARRFPERPPALGPVSSAIADAQESKTLPPATPDPAAPAEPKLPATSDPVLAPISEANPVGDDPKLTDEFDVLYAEVAKLEALGETTIDWPMIRDTSLQILAHKGKDLRCLAYWTYARLRLDGAKGLREGLASLVACAERYGDDLYPKRPKARAAALRWIGTRVEEDVATLLKQVPEEDAKAMHASLDAAEKVFGGRVASLEGLQRARGGLMRVKVLRPKPKPKPKPAPKAASATSSRPAAPPAAAIPDEYKDAVEAVLEQARALAAGGENELSLRLRRQAMWLVPPPLEQGRKWNCECPENSVRMSMQSLVRQKDWEEVLAQSEELLEAYPFCLDLTVWSASAAAELLDKKVEVALAADLVALVTRVPKLERGTDREGKPLASKAARAWINQYRGSEDAGAAGAAAGAPAPADAKAAASESAAPSAAAAPSPEALPPDIEALFKNGQIETAIGKASAVAAGLTGRLGFHRNLLLAERLLENRASGPFAFSMFRSLIGQLRTAALTQWEPKVGARCIRGYLQGARVTNTKVDDAQELLDELMLLDPSAAVGLL